MIKVLYVVDSYESIDDLKDSWLEHYESQVDPEDQITFEEFVEDGVYDEEIYILNHKTGECSDANEFARTFKD